MPSNNPRYANYHARTIMRERFKRRGDVCAICGKPIDYSLPHVDPKTHKVNLMSFELDEIVPISKGGSPIDENNLQATHRICNARKGNKLPEERTAMNKSFTTSTNWWA